MELTTSFLKSIIKNIPKIEPLANKITKAHNLHINYPISIDETDKKLPMISLGKIKSGNDLLLLSSTQCFFSKGFSGASLKQQSQITQQLNSLSSQYESLNQSFVERVKLVIQILANKQQTKSGKMPLYEFANYIIESPSKLQIAKSQINSRFLNQINHGIQAKLKLTYKYLHKNIFKRLQQAQYYNVCNNSKNFIREARNTELSYIAPFINHIDHSFTPNCQFQMMYLPHRKVPFIRIKTIKQIKQGQRPTICYGSFNNYQLLLRYGFTSQNNPFSNFVLPLNFQIIKDTLNKNIEWKQNMFIQKGLKLKTYIRIMPNGQIHVQDIKMLRIVMNENTNPNIEEIQQTKNDLTIYRFIKEHVKVMIQNLKINNCKISNDKYIKILQREEQTFLNKFLQIHNN